MPTVSKCIVCNNESKKHRVNAKFVATLKGAGLHELVNKKINIFIQNYSFLSI